jgi:hypothetical protein
MKEMIVFFCGASTTLATGILLGIPHDNLLQPFGLDHRVGAAHLRRSLQMCLHLHGLIGLK